MLLFFACASDYALRRNAVAPAIPRKAQPSSAIVEGSGTVAPPPPLPEPPPVVVDDASVRLPEFRNKGIVTSSLM
jgi:hypothetical protein